MIENIYWSQTQLAEHWQVAESTLERWRSEGIGPIYLKLMGSVLYRLSGITTLRRTHFEAVSLSAHQYATTGDD